MCGCGFTPNFYFLEIIMYNRSNTNLGAETPKESCLLCGNPLKTAESKRKRLCEECFSIKGETNV